MDGATLKSDLRRYAEDLRVADNLEAFASAIDVQSTAGKKAFYYLVELDADARTVKITGYQANDLQRALIDYQGIERATFNDGGHQDAVLVSAESLMALRQTYPNYYLDTRNFVDELKKAIS